VLVKARCISSVCQAGAWLMALLKLVLAGATACEWCIICTAYVPVHKHCTVDHGTPTYQTLQHIDIG
jgi:hypothetical protein